MDHYSTRREQRWEKSVKSEEYPPTDFLLSPKQRTATTGAPETGRFKASFISRRPKTPPQLMKVFRKTTAYISGCGQFLLLLSI